ncbi:MAG: hypothetical protein WD271_16580 [Acidimicrobiia bacterium]
MSIRRTTLSAEADDLMTLETEARIRGISMAQLLRELVHERAMELRAQRRPRGGLFASPPGSPSLSQLSVDDEDSPAATPYES